MRSVQVSHLFDFSYLINISTTLSIDSSIYLTMYLALSLIHRQVFGLCTTRGGNLTPSAEQHPRTAMYSLRAPLFTSYTNFVPLCTRTILDVVPRHKPVSSAFYSLLHCSSLHAAASCAPKMLFPSCNSSIYHNVCYFLNPLFGQMFRFRHRMD